MLIIGVLKVYAMFMQVSKATLKAICHCLEDISPQLVDGDLDNQPWGGLLGVGFMGQDCQHR